MLKAFFAQEQRQKILFVLLLLSFFTQFPFAQLLGVDGTFPFLIRKEEYPRFFLHAFQTICVWTLLGLLFVKVSAAFHQVKWSWKKEASFFFLMALAYWLYWIPLGFDVTDEGGRMAHSWFMYEGYWQANVDMKIGAHALNGLWLHLLPEPSVLWGRLAYALTKGAIGLFTFRILWKAFPRHRTEAFLFAFLGMLAISIYGGQVMNYNNLPVLIMLAAIIAFQESREAERPAISLWIGGSLIPLAIFCRFPFISFVFIAFLWVLWHWVIYRKPGDRNWGSLGWTALGIGTGTMLVIGIFLITGILDDYGQMIDRKLIQGFFYEKGESVRVHGHQKEALLSTYYRDLQRVLRSLVPMLLLSFGVSIPFCFLKRKWRRLLLPVFAFLFFLGAWWVIDEWHRWYYGVITLPIALLIYYLVMVRRLPPSPFVAYWSASLFLFAFLGSNNGAFNILITGGGVVAIAYAFFLVKRMEELPLPMGSNPKPVLWGAALLIPILVLTLKPQKIYRDGEQEELTKMMGHPSLFGIFSTPERVEKVDGIMEACERHITPYEDGLLVVNTAPMFYFLCEAPYSFRKDWEMRGKSPSEKRKALNGPDAPAFILMMRKDPRDWDWPNTERKCVDRDMPFYRFYEQYLKGERYRKVFGNGVFTLHQQVTRNEASSGS